MSKRNIIIVLSIAVAALVVALSVRCAHSSRASSTEDVADTVVVIDTAAVITAINTMSKLYTAEVTANKTMHYESENNIEFTLFGNTKKVKMPLGRTTADIPVSITYKAAIDLSKIKFSDVTIIGDSIIRISLPDPIIEETAVSVDHAKEKINSQMLAKNLDDATYQKLVKQAERDAWNELKKSDQQAVVETAKISASEILTPMLHDLGFRKVVVDYHPEYHIILLEKRP